MKGSRMPQHHPGDAEIWEDPAPSIKKKKKKKEKKNSHQITHHAKLTKSHFPTEITACEFEQTLGDSVQRSPACYSPRGRKELNTT